MIGFSKVRVRRLIGSAVLALVLPACGAAVAPGELHNARDAYQKAQQSRAAKLAPAQLDDARQALEKAEVAFRDGDDEQVVKDLAYIAQRRIAIAVSAGELEHASRELKDVERQKSQVREEVLASKEARLNMTKEELAAEKRKAEEEKRKLSGTIAKKEMDLEKQREATQRTQSELEAERKRRMEAEKKAAAALASLEEIAKVKEESRGIVITLSGAVLFATGKYELLPIAQQKLDDVAKALKDQGEDATIVVEGHTDSRGSSDKNRELSLLRAQGVRNYLISRGIKQENIKAVGLGEERPVSSNDTPEGRANNRRVEIVVNPKK